MTLQWGKSHIPNEYHPSTAKKVVESANKIYNDLIKRLTYTPISETVNIDI
jgi:hypothetical protein